MLELKFAIYHRTASLSSQASSTDVCSIGWRIIDQTKLSSDTPCTPTVQQSCIIITFHCYVICAHMYMWRKKWYHKGSSSVSNLNHLVTLQTCKKSMCENHHERVTQIELLKKFKFEIHLRSIVGINSMN